MTLARFSRSAFLLIFSVGILVGINLEAQAQNSQDAAAPPELGTNTKGTPAIAESAASNSAPEPDSKAQTNSAAPAARATEYRRESGAVYRIELDNTIGAKQYIEETDSDGQLLGNKHSDIEETTNLPKWKLGSW